MYVYSLSVCFHTYIPNTPPNSDFAGHCFFFRDIQIYTMLVVKNKICIYTHAHVEVDHLHIWVIQVKPCRGYPVGSRSRVTLMLV